VVGQLCKNNQASFFESFNRMLLPVFQPLLGEGIPEGLTLPAMCIIDDVVEYCGPHSQAYVSWFYPAVVRLCASEAVELRHSAAFGVRYI